MFRRLTPLLCVLVIMVVFAAQCAAVYHQLPLKMATHFGPTGHPDGWMPRDDFLKSYGLFLLIITATIGSSSLLFRVVPTELINLPNKQFWLAPARKQETLDRLGLSMSAMMLATGSLLIALVQLIFNANMTPDPQLGNASNVILGAYSIYMVVWTVSLVRRFQVPRS